MSSYNNLTLVEAFEAAAISVGSKAKDSDVKIKDLKEAFIAYNDEFQATVDELTSVVKPAPDVTSYTDLRGRIKAYISDLETANTSGGSKRKPYKAQPARELKQSAFNMDVSSLEATRITLDATAAMWKARSDPAASE